MTQVLTLKIKLKPSKNEVKMLKESSLAYIKTVNTLVSEMVKTKTLTKKTTKHIQSPLNSAVKNQAIRDAKSIFRKVKKSDFKILPLLKKPVIIWNNQNFKVENNGISMPFFVDGQSKRVKLKAFLNTRDFEILHTAKKLGTLRVTQKGDKWVAQISLEMPTEQNASTKVMGVDLGVKVPAVCITNQKEVKFVGNGRMNKFVRRYHNSRRKKLGRAKKLNAIKKSQNKEQRWMQDQDHKISREIVDFAIKQQVGIIRLEKLSGIRQSTRTSRKNNHSLSNWSFYRLSQYIEYKANLVGIQVEHVNPAYTSQQCPSCRNKHKATDRHYHCKDCGFIGHRDLVGAWNIITAPVLDGKSRVA